MTITIEQNIPNFFDNCSDLENVDESATIRAIQEASEKRISNVYPEAEIEFTSGDRTRVFAQNDDIDLDDVSEWVRAVLNDEFANEVNWKMI